MTSDNFLGGEDDFLSYRLDFLIKLFSASENAWKLGRAFTDPSP